MNELVTFVLLIVPQALWASMSAREVMAKSEEVRKLRTVNSSSRIKTGDRTKEFRWWRKLSDDRVHYNTLTRFISPAEVKGEGILFIEHENDNADIQMYLPNFKKVRRVESDQQSGSFMGSEFSYSDIATPHLDDYTYKLVKEEGCGDGQKCFVIEERPATDKVKERTGVSRGLSWIRQDNFMAEKQESYDLNGQLWKKMTTQKMQEVDKTDHKWMALALKMENVLKNRETILEFSELKVNQDIPDLVFTVQNLSRDK